MNLNIENIFDQVEAKNTLDYRNPFDRPFGNPDRTTRSQQLAWDYLNEYQEKSPYIAFLGAKGSAKTHFCAAAAFHLGQSFPGSVGCVISNSYQQTKDNAGAMFIEMARMLNFKTEFFSSKKVFGKSITSLFIVDLDGKGFDKGKNFYLLVRSFDAVQKLEGIEIDWLWVEEVQQADKENFITANSRIRGKRSPNVRLIAGMPEDEIHWQYSFLPTLGALEEEKREKGEQIFGEDPLTGEKRERFGILLEPTVYENKENLPPEYIDNLYAMYDKEMAERYIYGKRTSLSSNKVAYNYRDWKHRTGRMSRLSCKYNKHDLLVVSIDFNAANMHATLWQRKPWNDKWEDEAIVEKMGGIVREGLFYPSFSDFCPADRQILAQVDEFQIKEGGTQNLMRRICEKYAKHEGGVLFIGDASGNHEHSSSSRTDWDIITQESSGLLNRSVLRGLVANPDFKNGRTKYSNPPKRDQINIVNLSLLDANGQQHMCFLPESQYIDGGAAASVFAMKRDEAGRIDDKCDRSELPETPKTHFFDTVCYVCYWYKGGQAQTSATYFRQAIKTTIKDTVLSKSVFNNKKRAGSRVSHGKSWGGVFG